MRELWSGLRCLLAVCAVTTIASTANAGMTLTANGVSRGFSLSTFADGFPTTTHLGLLIGPLGVGFNNTGGVLVSDRFGDVRLFPTDVDGQHANLVTPAQNYGDFSALGIEKFGGSIYMATHVGGAVVQLNNNGTLNQTIVTGISTARDIVANPANGHLFVSGQDGIWDVNPTAHTKTLVLGGATDGIALVGTTLYAARGFNGTDFNSIQGFNINSWTPTFDSGVILGVDGIAIGFGSLAGKIYGNTNFGELWEVDLSSLQRTLIASGGSRGDMIKVDPSGTSFLFTQSDSVLRLTAPEGGSFAPSAVPEPASLAVFGVGLAGLICLRRRRTSCE